MKETWKSLDGLVKNGDNYEISDLGNVKNVTTGKIRKNQIDKDGYLWVSLYKNNKPFNAKIHRLIALAFIPNPDNKPTVNHKDGNKKNNDISNLEWSTSSENNKHAYDIGLKIPHKMLGEKHPNSKLSEKDILKIREMYSYGIYSYRDLGKIFNIDYTMIGKIINRDNWNHI